MHIIHVAKSSSIPGIRILDATMINQNVITIVPSYLLCSCYDAYFYACCCALFQTDGQSDTRPGLFSSHCPSSFILFIIFSSFYSII